MNKINKNILDEDKTNLSLDSYKLSQLDGSMIL